MDESKIIEIIAKYEKHKEQNRMAAKRFYYKNRDDPEFQARRRAYYQRTKAGTSRQKPCLPNPESGSARTEPRVQTQTEQKISV